jgi:phosphoenolpyruvate carboxylase
MSKPLEQAPASKRQSIHFAEKDAALRKDVRELGKMAGELLLEQGGEALYKTVESARRYAIKRRENDAEANAKLEKLLFELGATASRDVVRAFSTYFQIVNTAEQVHRIRRRREYLKDADVKQPRSFDQTFSDLKTSGLEAKSIESLLAGLAIQPVFTEHPTETTRRTILRKHQNIVRRLVDMQNPALTPQEHSACFESIRADVTAIWQTEESPTENYTVFDELEHTLFFATDVIYRIIPPFYEAIETALQDIYGDVAARIRIPNLLRFGSWIGGDFSADAELSARTVRDVMQRQRSLLLDLYYKDCRALSEKLSQSETRVDVDQIIKDRIDQYARQFPGVHGTTPHRYSKMPYRVFLRLVSHRLQATYDEDAFAYESPQQFIDDLHIVSSSLGNRRGVNAGQFAVKRLIRRAETFGFHFLSLDMRHDANDLQKIIAFCLDDDLWLTTDRSERATRLQHMLEINDSPLVEPDNNAKRLFAVFRAIAYCRRKHGPDAIGALLVRHCAGVDDILAAMLLARWSNIQSVDGTIPVNFVPCFENNTELKRAAPLLTELMANPLYRRNLEARGSHQTVKLSISDATADGSVAGSRWNMQQAHTELSKIFDAAGIEYTFFHGRGSLSGRGGVADGLAHGHLRATEHGEAVNERYGVRGIAVRTLEKAFSAVATATAGLRGNEAPDANWTVAMSRLASAADQSFSDLVDSRFDEYFQLATPIDVIEHMRSGTAPDSTDMESRRNLPWAFAWEQGRFLLPAWFGTGTGLQDCMAETNIDEMRRMLEQWPFFRRLIDDVEVALTIADPGIASHYSRLAGEELHNKYFPVIQAEYTRCVEALLTLRQQDTLLESNSTLRRSIRLRNPYVDPMSLLQVSLLRRWREEGRPEGKLLMALRSSVNGISRGLQTSG